MTPPCAILFAKMKGELLMKLFIGSDIHGSSANIRRFLDIVADARKDSPDVKVVLLGIYTTTARAIRSPKDTRLCKLPKCSTIQKILSASSRAIATAK